MRAAKYSAGHERIVKKKGTVDYKIYRPFFNFVPLNAQVDYYQYS